MRTYTLLSGGSVTTAVLSSTTPTLRTVSRHGTVTALQIPLAYLSQRRTLSCASLYTARATAQMRKISGSAPAAGQLCPADPVLGFRRLLHKSSRTTGGGARPAGRTSPSRRNKSCVDVQRRQHVIKYKICGAAKIGLTQHVTRQHKAASCPKQCSRVTLLELM